MPQVWGLDLFASPFLHLHYNSLALGMANENVGFQVLVRET